MDECANISNISQSIDEAARRQFEQAWRMGQPRPLDEFLPGADDPRYLPLLEELVHIDLEFGWKSPRQSAHASSAPAQPPRVESYLSRFDTLRHPEILLRLLRQEYLVRHRYGDQPAAEEFLRRFPGPLAPRLMEILTTNQMEAADTASKATGAGAGFRGTPRFSVIRRLGAGGMGVVYEVVDQERNARVALKTLPQLHAAPLYRFKQEFRSLADLIHPHLVPLYELISLGDQWFFTMELVDGTDFLFYVCGGPAERVDFKRLRETLRQLVQGLLALHQAGKLHRDIKPSNVMVRRDGHVVLLDFGLVKELSLSPYSRLSDQQHRWQAADDPLPADDQTADAYIVGTAAYMAPEQAAGQPVLQSADWYSVGVMLFEALTGRHPFTGSTALILQSKQLSDPPHPAELVPGLPDDLNGLCMDLLQRDPRLRPGGVEVLRRLGPPAAGTRDDSPVRLPQSIAFVGRQDQLSALNEAYRQMLEGQCVIVTVGGCSGVGKTALIQQFLNQLSPAPGMVLAGRCYERESVPYKAVDSLIDMLSRYLLELPPHGTAELIDPDMAALARLFPVLRRVPAVAKLAEASYPVDDVREVRRRAFDALRLLLDHLGGRHAVVLWIDDLQWGDADSAALLKRLLHGTDAPRLLLLACHRSPDTDQSGCLQALKFAGQEISKRSVLELNLEPLGCEDARQLARAALAGDPAAEPRAEQIAEESRGNPFFAWELAREVRRGAASSSGSAGVPAVSLEKMVWQRVNRLPESARGVLETVAVAGQPLRARDAYQAAGVEPSDRHCLASLKSEHLLRSTGPGLDDKIETFHDCVRDSVLAHLDADRLRVRHRRLAISLEASGQGDPETIAIHFAGARESEKAGQHYALAAQLAASALAFDRAAALYQRSLELLPAGGHARRVALAEALANAGRGADAGAAFESAWEEAAGDERLELQRLAALQYCISGRVEKGCRIFQDVLRQVGLTLPTAGSRGMLSLLGQRARLRLRSFCKTASRIIPARRPHENFPAAIPLDPLRDASQIPRGQLRRIDVLWSVTPGLVVVEPFGVATLQTQGLLLALQAGEPYRLARCLAMEAAYVGYGGVATNGRAQAILQQARQLAQRINSPHALGLVELTAAHLAFQQSDFQQALEHCRWAEELFRSQCTGAWWEISTVHAFLIWTFGFTGQLRRLAECDTAYLSEARTRSDLFTVTNLTAFARPLLRLAADDPQGAQDEVDEALQQWPHPGFHLQHYHAASAQTCIHLYCGRGAAAWQHIQRIWPALRRSMLLRVQFIRTWMLNLRAMSALAYAAELSRRERLLKCAQRDARRIARERTPWGTALAQRLLAGVAHARGETDQAARFLEASIRSFDSVGMKLPAAAARHRLGALLDGHSGAELMSQAESAMREEGVQNIDRLTAMYSFPWR